MLLRKYTASQYVQMFRLVFNVFVFIFFNVFSFTQKGQFSSGGCVYSCTNDDGEDSILSRSVTVRYHIPEDLKACLNFRLPILAESGSYAERIKRYLQNPDDPDDKGNPNLIFYEHIKDSEVNEWSLLSMSADKGNDELVYLLRRQGANDDYQDPYGITALHRAAFRGHTVSLQNLLDPTIRTDRKIANVFSMDFFGLIPGDYLRIALYGCQMHGHHELKGLLDSAEEAELIAMKRKSKQVERFIDVFVRDCDGIVMSEQLLNIGMIARSSDPMSFSNIISILGNVVPLPGASTVSAVIGGGASLVEGRIADRQTARFLENSSIISHDMKREFRKLAYFLADLYEENLERLTPVGAGQLGAYGAKRVAKYIKSLRSSEDIKDVGFIRQIEHYFYGIEVRPIRDGMLHLGEVLDGSSWRAREVLNGSVGNLKITAKRKEPANIPSIHSVMGTLVLEQHDSEGNFDRAEMNRIEILLREGEEERGFIVSNSHDSVIPLDSARLAAAASEQRENKETRGSIMISSHDPYVPSDGARFPAAASEKCEEEEIYIKTNDITHVVVLGQREQKLPDDSLVKITENIALGRGAVAGGEIDDEYEAEFKSTAAINPSTAKEAIENGAKNVAIGDAAMSGVKIKGKVKLSFS